MSLPFPLGGLDSCLDICIPTGPFLDRINLPLRLIKTNGSFFPQIPPSLYLLPAGDPRGEAAWDRVAGERRLELSMMRADVLAMGRDPDVLYKYPASMGLGPDAYLARFDIFHQLHCLNMLRKAANPSVFSAGFHDLRIGNSTVGWTEHVQHCQYGLFQALTCNPDFAAVTFVAAEGDGLPELDLSISRKCVDWDGVVRWMEENAIHVTQEQLELIVQNRPERSVPAAGISKPFG